QLSLKYEKVHSVLFNSLIYFFPNFARNIGKEFKPIDNAIARQCVSTGTYFYTYFFQDKELRYKSSNQIKELIKRNNNHEIAEYIFSMSEKKENLQFVLICLYENWKIDKTNNDGNTIDLLQEIFYFGNESKDNTWLYIINEKFLNDEKTTQESLTFRNILDNLGNKETFSSYYKSIILFLKSNLYNDKKPDYLGDMEKELFDYLITQKESCLDFDIKLFSNLLEILWFEKQNDNTNTLLSWSDKYIIYFILSFMWIINKPYPNFYEKNEKRSTECLLNKMNFKVPILFEKEEFIKNYIDSLEYKKFSDNDRLIFDSYCYSVGIMDYDDKENKYKLVKDYGNKSDN
ncbi:MAG: hypothetical protein MJ181_12120, partial [Treponema sp.]|nr:hypothetical protein [Treponema sp.]